jgi:hypothetical protein
MASYHFNEIISSVLVNPVSATLTFIQKMLNRSTSLLLYSDQIKNIKVLFLSFSSTRRVVLGFASFATLSKWTLSCWEAACLSLLHRPSLQSISDYYTPHCMLSRW